MFANTPIMRELLDLARFVSELGKPGPYAVRTTPTVQRWRVLTRPAAALTRVVPSDDAIQQYVQGAPAVPHFRSARAVARRTQPTVITRRKPGFPLSVWVFAAMIAGVVSFAPAISQGWQRIRAAFP